MFHCDFKKRKIETMEKTLIWTKFEQSEKFVQSEKFGHNTVTRTK